MNTQIKYFHKLLTIPAALLLLVTSLAACQKEEVVISQEPISKSAFLLNTIVTITVYSEDHEYALDEALNVCEQYEYLFSRTIDTSAISQLNDRGSSQTTLTVDDDVWELLTMSHRYSELSGGVYDITVEPLTSLWNFSSAAPVVPAPSAIEAAVAEVDYRNVVLADGQITFLEPYTRLDLGAVAKGYIADKIKEYLEGEGIESAIINLGGNVLCVGTKPDGSPFRVGIQKPFENRNETIAAVDVEGKSVVSSGIYERYFKEEGVLYHHILDPYTGWPVENNLLSVTVISDTSADGDCLSTACFALGLEKGIELIDALDGIYGIFITDSDEIYYSAGAEALIIK